MKEGYKRAHKLFHIRLGNEGKLGNELVRLRGYYTQSPMQKLLESYHTFEHTYKLSGIPRLIYTAPDKRIAEALELKKTRLIPLIKRLENLHGGS